MAHEEDSPLSCCIKYYFQSCKQVPASTDFKFKLLQETCECTTTSWLIIFKNYLYEYALEECVDGSFCVPQEMWSPKALFLSQFKTRLSPSIHSVTLSPADTPAVEATTPTPDYLMFIYSLLHTSSPLSCWHTYYPGQAACVNNAWLFFGLVKCSEAFGAACQWETERERERLDWRMRDVIFFFLIQHQLINQLVRGRLCPIESIGGDVRN